MKFNLLTENKEYHAEYQKQILIFGTVFVVHTWVDDGIYAEIIPLDRVEFYEEVPPTKELN